MSDPTKPAYEPPDPEWPTPATPAEEMLDSETPGGALDEARHDPYAALRIANYRNYAIGNVFSFVGMQMFSLAIGWELYQRTNSPTALGLVGLVQVVPIVALALVAGQLADRFNRKHIIMVDQLLLAVSAVTLGLASLYHEYLPDWPILHSANAQLAALARFLGESRPTFEDRHIPILFGLLFVNGIVRAFNQPTRHSLLPQLVPAEVFPNAVTWNSSLFEVCNVAGPMLAGFAIAILQRYCVPGSPLPYATIYFFNGGCQLAQLLFFVPIRLIPMARMREPVTLRSLLAGIHFVWNTKPIIATITLDMFAVLLGGATALLPMFARDILHVGPMGLGWLRAMPSVGAFAMALILAHRPPMRQAGRALHRAVIGFGVATILFGLTGFLPAQLGPTVGFPVALVALLLTGAFDNISVVIRHTLVQMLTPDAMRGRVSAVNSMFISTSNELGALESGVTAAIFGATVSVIGGGVGTIVVVLMVSAAWPQIRRIGSLQEVAAQAGGAVPGEGTEERSAEEPVAVGEGRKERWPTDWGRGGGVKA